MSLQQLQAGVYYIPDVSNIGVIEGAQGQAILIDSGIGEHSGKRILGLLEERGFRPVAILNTHGHGDHTGGNAYIVARTGARVFAPGRDAVLLQDPVWSALSIFCGAEPIPPLSVPRYVPRPCQVDEVIYEGPYEIADVPIQVVALPGHTSANVGYLVDGVLFVGDAVTGDDELERVRIPYAYSVTEQLRTLQKLCDTSYPWYVPGHGGAYQQIRDLAARNIARVEEVLAFIRAYVVQHPAQSSDILEAIAQHYKVHLRHIRDYYLFQSTVHAYLGHLYRTGQIASELQGSRLYWISPA